MNTYILKYYDTCFVAYNDLAFETNEQPDLSFMYSSIDYDSTRPENYYVLNTHRYKITSKEEESIQKYCSEFVSNHDFYVYAINENNLYFKKVYKSEAEKDGLKYIINQIPPYPVSRWNEKINTWEEIVMIIKEDGTVVRHPASFCDQCTIFLTQKEVNDLENINDHDDEYHKYDYESREWFVSGSELESRRKALIYRVRKLYDTKRWLHVYGHYVPEYERYGWQIEVSEAVKYYKNKSAKTPYIDGILEGLGDVYTGTKDDYVNSILENIDPKKFNNLGKIHGEMQRYVYRLRDAKTVDELLELEKEISKIKY